MPIGGIADRGDRMFALILSAFLGVSASAAEPVCLDGFYDLGPRAAALGFACVTDQGSSSGRINFCERDVLLRTGHCAGDLDSIPCDWSGEEGLWRCQERGESPFEAVVRRTSPKTISYHFHSGFNEGELTGTRID